MKKIGLFIGLGVLVAGGGIAMAASAKKGVKSLTPAERALASIQTGNALTMKQDGLTLAQEVPAIGAALVSIAQIQEDAAQHSSGAVIQYTIGTADPAKLYQLAQQAALGTEWQAKINGVAQLVVWLQGGAQGATPLAQTASVATASTAAETASSGSTALTNAQTTEIATVISSRDVAKIQALAAKYVTTHPEVAKALYAAAQAIITQASTGQTATVSTSAASVAAAQAAAAAAAAQAAAKETSKIDAATVATAPATIATVATSVDTAAEKLAKRKLLASKVALAYKTAKKVNGSTVPSSAAVLCKAFQIQEGLAKQAGLYGSETALALAERYGIVPPKPLYWGTKGGDYKAYLADREQYSNRIAALAANDPARADEWAAAAKLK